MYIERSVNEVRRFSAMFKNSVTVIPIAPPPLCGIPDAETVRSLYDYTLWLDGLPDYSLMGYNAVLRQILVNTKAEPVSHVPGRVVLITSLYEFDKKLFERQGWQGLPSSVPPLSPQEEKALLTPLLEGLSTQFRMNIDTLPNLSRDNTIFPTGPSTVEEDIRPLHRRQQRGPPRQLRRHSGSGDRNHHHGRMGPFDGCRHSHTSTSDGALWLPPSRSTCSDLLPGQFQLLLCQQ